jgi:hypothetical protein
VHATTNPIENDAANNGVAAGMKTVITMNTRFEHADARSFASIRARDLFGDAVARVLGGGLADSDVTVSQPMQWGSGVVMEVRVELIGSGLSPEAAVEKIESANFNLDVAMGFQSADHSTMQGTFDADGLIITNPEVKTVPIASGSGGFAPNHMLSSAKVLCIVAGVVLLVHLLASSQTRRDEYQRIGAERKNRSEVEMSDLS